MNVSKLPSQDLLRLCLQAHDESLWLEFVRCTRPFIARVVVKSIRHWTAPSPDLVDDLVQETYLKLCANDFRALRRFDFRHENALLGFVKVVASNAVQDHFRHIESIKRGSGKVDGDLETVSLSVASGSSSVANVERRLQISEIARCLDSQVGEPNFTRDRTIFWLYYRQGMTARAISETPAIGLSVKGVESILLRLTRMVREKLRSSEKSSRSEPSGSSRPASAGNG